MALRLPAFEVQRIRLARTATRRFQSIARKVDDRALVGRTAADLMEAGLAQRTLEREPVVHPAVHLATGTKPCLAQSLRALCPEEQGCARDADAPQDRRSADRKSVA